MPTRDLGALLAAAALIGCGSSSSNTDLFGSHGGAVSCVAASAESCQHESGCPAHRVCAPDGKSYWPCTCDSSGTGGSPGGSGGEPPATGGSGSGVSFSDSGPGGYTSDSGGSGAGGSVPALCPVQSFTGTATGSNYSSSLGLKVDVKATLAFSVSETGTVTGTYTGVTPGKSTATLGGSMDCSTLAVTITIENGSYPGSLFPPAAGGTFTGTLTGTYATDAATFSGQWTIQEGNPAYGGQGIWNAN